VFRELCRILPEDGWFVSYDYIGPHRNQYGPSAWDAAWSLNGELPASLRQDLQYPHLPTMLVTDPTEAIHSELIVETLHRYFTVSEFTPLGGALAYPLLTHNARLFEADDSAERSKWIDRIMEADDRFLTEHPGSTLFAYFAGTPDESVLREGERLSRWATEESEREQRAARAGGEYYDRGALSTALIALEDARQDEVRVTARLEALESEVAVLRADPLYGAIRSVLDAGVIRRLRGNRLVGTAERRTRAALHRGSPGGSPAR